MAYHNVGKWAIFESQILGYLYTTFDMMVFKRLLQQVRLALILRLTMGLYGCLPS